MHAAVNSLLRSEKVRFGIVGIINTTVDFIVLLSLTILVGVPAVIANIASTSCAMTVSFLLNKKAVFGDTDRRNKRQVLLFIAVTLSGIWFVQSIVIVLVYGLLLTLLHGYDPTLLLILSKLLATMVSFVWNYVGYSRIVFGKRSK